MYIRRKLYSNIEGGKVPVEQTTLFSAKDDAKSATVGAGTVAGAAGVGAAGLYGAKKATDKVASNVVANKAAHEKVAKVSDKVNRIIKSGKDWINNEQGKAQAKAYKANIAGKSGAVKAAMEKKLGTLEKAANKVARNRKIGVGLAAAGALAAGAGIGVGISRLKGKKAEEKKAEEKVYSVLMTEEELRIFADAKEQFDGKKIKIGSKVRIWADKHLQTKKDREAMIEAYDQEGPRNSHKLGKQSAKYAVGGSALGAAIGVGSIAASNPESTKELINRTKRVLKVATKNKKVAKAVAKNVAKASAIGAGLTGAAAGSAYLGTRGGHLIRKGIENISEKVSHDSQKIADENKVASGKMSKEEFASKYGKKVKLDSKK